MRIVHTKELDDHRGAADDRRRAGAGNAKSQAADLLASAQREADQLRLAAQQEVNELRTGAQREAEQSRAAADREVQEARRMLAVETERLAREATEHHTTATGRDQAAGRGGRGSGPRPPRSGPARPTQQATEARGAAQSEAEALLTRARREAEQIVAAANTQAESIIASGDSEAAAPAGRAQGRGGPAGQAPRRDHRPARLAARRRRRLRRRRVERGTPDATEQGAGPDRSAPTTRTPAETEDEPARSAARRTSVSPAPRWTAGRRSIIGFVGAHRRAAGVLAADQHRGRSARRCC